MSGYSYKGGREKEGRTMILAPVFGTSAIKPVCSRGSKAARTFVAIALGEYTSGFGKTYLVEL
jgi:hypothetical protein